MIKEIQNKNGSPGSEDDDVSLSSFSSRKSSEKSYNFSSKSMRSDNKDHQTSFDIKDLSSLYEAEIDQNLVENFML